ncbi:MAG TPA: methyltransferase domain-containing protein [Chthonomonadaceae bacterium]|nr:methyltransferase domain-containing protein [Chthonomonadaceae bacterium]
MRECMEEALLIFYLRSARRKAREAAVQEALCLLGDLGPTAPAGGPLAEEGGLFWIALPAAHREEAQARLPRLGYTHAVDVLEAEEGGRDAATGRMVRWRRRPYRLIPLYREEEAAFRERAPDRRVFWLAAAEGVRAVRGYRGDSGPLSRRGLPVEDARLLVNLVARPGGTLLDPFAGAGGVVAEANGCRVLSCDLDPALRYGLAGLGARHCVADARSLPFQTASVDAIATEPPFEGAAEATVRAALGEMTRILAPGGRLAIYCAAHQAPGLREAGRALGLVPFLDQPINRKGTACVVLAWHKDSAP